MCIKRFLLFMLFMSMHITHREVDWLIDVRANEREKINTKRKTKKIPERKSYAWIFSSNKKKRTSNIRRPHDEYR